jgi:hypothetical protein
VKRFILTVSQKSAEGKIGHAVGEDIEALQGRKAEQQIGRAGNGDRRPERKGVASTSRDLRNDPRPKSQQLGLPDSRRSEAPRGVYEGTESFSGDAWYRKPGYPHLAQPAEPPYADPHVRWCGRGGRVIVPPIPIVPSMFDSLEVQVLYPV